MYDQYVNELAQKYKNSRGKGVFSRYLDEHNREILCQYTSFLPVSAPISQRFWHIINDSYHIIYCPTCNLPTNWEKSCGKYNTHCSQKCQGKSFFIKKKKEITCLEKFGFKNTSLSPKIKQKKKETCLKNWGVEFPQQSEIIRQKGKQTNLEKYGVENPQQKYMLEVLPLLRDYDWLYNEYVNKKKTALYIGKELNVSDVLIGRYLRNHNIGVRYLNGFSYKCIQWLESIMQEENIFIQHAQNIGEYRIPGTRFYVDGYCRETNTIYEFHGDYWHGNPKLYNENYMTFMYVTTGELFQKTIERENLIKELGYDLVVMWENNWNKLSENQR
ncbi:MAG: DUF7487 domain-containing protein [Nitrosopumilaceae archaeon]